MSGLVERLRTGTHEQAVGLLRECWDLTHRATIPSPVMSGYAAWRMADDTFGDLLSIGTPEACVGAAMMLMPRECCIERMGEVPDNPEPSRWHCVLWREDENVPANPYPGEEASTAALALAAAIMETKNV